MHKVLVVLLLATVGLSGCLSQSGDSSFQGFMRTPEVIVIAGQGSKAGTVEHTPDCPEDATLALGAQGNGDIWVQVKDGADNVVQDVHFGNRQAGAAASLSGEPGEWTFTVDFAFHDAFGLRPGAYNGQWAITFTC